MTMTDEDRRLYEAEIARQGNAMLQALVKAVVELGGVDPNATFGVALRLVAMAMVESDGALTLDDAIEKLREHVPTLHAELIEAERAHARAN